MGLTICCRRVEPDIQYFCDIDYDVFQMMKDNQFKYGTHSLLEITGDTHTKGVGWTVSLTEYMQTIPTLWSTAVEFMKTHKDYIVTGEESIMPWVTDDNFLTYNGCHFWSNFEVKSKSLKYVHNITLPLTDRILGLPSKQKVYRVL